MGGWTWFSVPFRDAVTTAVSSVEQRTSAEIVIAVRPTSGSYRHVDFAVGNGTALLALCLFLYHPRPFDFTLLPLELGASFAFGALLCASIPALRRSLTPNSSMQEAAEQAARAAFVDLGIHKTRSRNGVLIFVAAFEQRVIVLTDVGVPLEQLGATWKEFRETLQNRARCGPRAFIEALSPLGPLLERELPRAADDVNELVDGVAEVRA